MPFEYTRLDKIIEIAFTVAEEVSEAEEEQTPADAAADIDSPKQRHTPGDVLEQVRTKIERALSGNYSPLIKRSRALYWSVDKSVRAAVTISKLYDNGGFWYAHHPPWETFLSKGTTGLLVLGRIGRDEAYAIPYAWIHAKLGYLYITERKDTKYWHLVLQPDSDQRLLLRLKNGESESLEAFRFPFSSPAAASA